MLVRPILIAPGCLPHRRLAMTALGLAVAGTSFAQTSDSDEPVQLSPLVVSASGFEQFIQDAPASISVITREQLQEKRASNLAEALEDEEGIDVGGSAGKTGGMDVRMRGMPSQYTLILIDGRRQNVAGNVTPNGFNSTETSFMPPLSAIERIEVIRGPMSTLYGSDAMGGVINIITRKVSPEWGGEVTLEGTVHEDSDFGDSRGISLQTSGPLVKDRLGIQLRGRLFDRDASELSFVNANGEREPVSQRGPSPVEADLYTLGGRLTYTPTTDHDLWLDAERSRQRYNNDAGQLGTLDDPAADDISGYSDELAFERDQVSVGHTGRFSVGTLDSSLMHNTTETLGRTIPDVTIEDPPGIETYYGDGDPHPTLPHAPLIGSSRELETTNLVLDTKLSAPVGDAHMLTVGGQWWDAEMTDGLANEEFTQTTWALFGEDEWLLRDDLAFTVGARYDHHDAFGSQISPRAYLVWSATDAWTLKGGVSRGYRTPDLNDLHDGVNGITGQGTVLTIGNPDLEPETSTSSEVGFSYEHPNGFRAGATVFHNDFDDKIAGGPDINVSGHPTIPDGIYGQDVNIDKAVTRGAELTTSIPLAQAWTLTANYTYTDSEQKSGDNKGDPLTDTPKHLLNAKLGWQVTQRFDTWLRGEYASERYRAREQIRGGASYADLGDYKAYTLFHLGGRYQATENVSFNATIYNLLDKDFIDYQAYTYEGEVRHGNRYANLEPGRRLWISTNIAF